MRKIVTMLAAAFVLSFAAGAMAQSNPTGSQSAPQPGLPPGAGVGAPNAQQPMSTGDVTTTRVGPSAAAPAPMTDTGTTPMTHMHHRHHHHHHHAARHRAMPAATAPAAQ